MATAMRLGRLDMSSLRARQVLARDFHDFDWLIAMDAGHHAILTRIAGSGGGSACRGSIRRFMAFLGDPGGDVPDPYYGGQNGFDQVYDMIDRGCGRILEEICRERGLKGVL
jgi:protein-tyrosine phosphatase